MFMIDIGFDETNFKLVRTQIRSFLEIVVASNSFIYFSLLPSRIAFRR
jgi:hypothetical protein